MQLAHLLKAFEHLHRDMPEKKRLADKKQNHMPGKAYIPKTPRLGARGQNSARLAASPLDLDLVVGHSISIPGPCMRYLRKNLLAAHAMIGPPLKELSLALVGDAAMSKLHMRFMSIPGPTDVLTFSLDHDARGRVIAGEVVICVPEARRKSRQMRTPLDRELLLYGLHGMLHLYGLDDRTAVGFLEMHRTEDEILERLGVGPVFAPDIRGRQHRRDRTGEA
jgi:probable rRNA maturation factor